jgi:hypothetical protein
MSEIDDLLRAYDKMVRLHWDEALAGPQKVWFAVYAPSQERRLRLRLKDFEVATKQAGHSWSHVDLTDTFAGWMAAHEYRDAYFEQPDQLEFALTDYAEHTASLVAAALQTPSADEYTVVAVSGVGSLLGLARTSHLVERVASHIRGRLLIFFPGIHEEAKYRLLGVGDGWNYLATAITAEMGR